MKKEYYIQGDPARAEEIKAAFEELGINVLDFGFADKTVVYCSIGECVQYLPYSINLMNILYSHPDYQELPLHVKSNPKFKSGTWLWHKTKGVFPMMVEDYDEKEGYLMQFTDGVKCYFGRDIIENDYRLWTIQDAKDGDVLVASDESLFIFTRTKDNAAYYHYSLCKNGSQEISDGKHAWEVAKYCHPATKEQRDLLFQKVKEAGYQWDADKKELKKIQPHYNISNFKVGMPVLIRNYNNNQWEFTFFGRYQKDKEYPFRCADGYTHIQCIPYEGNEALLGTTDMCEERFINW